MNPQSPSPAVTIADIRKAADRIAPHAIRTPLLESPRLNDWLGFRLLVKCENLQHTGSFKLRGATNALMSLPDSVTDVVAYSSGNHAQAVARAASRRGMIATIVMPEDAPALKIEGTKAYGAEVVTYDRYSESREEIGGAIGYIDAGHGHSEGLKEIELQNVHGTYLSSRRAAEKGGIGAAAAAIPDSADADFGSVDLLNKAGEFTWPIVAMSYVYVRKDLSFVETPEQQSLLIAFLKDLYDPKAIEQCSIFGFTRVPNSVRKIALKGIEMIQVDSSAPEWTVEEDTIPGEGQGTYVISHKRRSYAEYQRYSQESDLEKAMAKIAELEAKISGESAAPANTASFASTAAYTDSDAQKLTAALALGAISFTLWCIAGLAFIAKRMCGV